MNDTSNKPATQECAPFKTFAPWLVALFLAAFGAHLWLVWLYGSSTPVWDQWYEAALFKSWANGTWTCADFFSGNNEHRVFLTRVLDVSLISLNGRWEPMLQMAVNAGIAAAYACILAWSLWDALGRRQGWLVCAMLVPFFTLPYGGENTTWGFNSQEYFVNIFGLLTIVGLGFGKFGSGRWYLGAIAAVISLFTMANGLLAPVAAGALIVLRMIKNRRFERAGIISLVVCVVACFAGAALNITRDVDRTFQAHSYQEFVNALLRNLSWPFYNAPIMPCFVILPLALLLAFYLRPNFRETRAAELLLALGLWSALQSIILSYGRANYGGDFPVSRYMDWFCTLVIASVFAAVVLAQTQEHHARFKKILATVFFAIIFCGMCRISDIVVEGLLIKIRMLNLTSGAQIEQFCATGNVSDFLESPTVPPDPKLALSVLQDPQLQPILPASCITAPATGPERLLPLAQWLISHSMVILSLGLALFVVLSARELTGGKPGLVARNPAALLPLLAGLMALVFVFLKHGNTREATEYQMQIRIAGDFKAAGNLKRAALHEQKAAALAPFVN